MSPKWVPQMADTAAVLADCAAKPVESYPVSFPNMRGSRSGARFGLRRGRDLRRRQRDLFPPQHQLLDRGEYRAFRAGCRSGASEHKIQSSVATSPSWSTAPMKGPIAPKRGRRSRREDYGRSAATKFRSAKPIGTCDAGANPGHDRSGREPSARDETRRPLPRHATARRSPISWPRWNSASPAPDSSVAGLGGCPYAAPVRHR